MQELLSEYCVSNAFLRCPFFLCTKVRNMHMYDFQICKTLFLHASLRLKYFNGWNEWNKWIGLGLISCFFICLFLICAGVSRVTMYWALCVTIWFASGGKVPNHLVAIKKRPVQTWVTQHHYEHIWWYKYVNQNEMCPFTVSALYSGMSFHIGRACPFTSNANFQHKYR